jgi:hypothetical protein
MDQTQLDRIERKLDEVLAFRDLLLKLALPKLPAPMREKAAAALAGRAGRP